MPHKHTRKGELDKSKTDLPPSLIANPLPVSKSAKENGIFTSELTNTRRTNKKRKRNADNADDTPKAFARLMAFTQGKKLPKGLDDGVKTSNKKAKKGITATSPQGEQGSNEASTEEAALAVPTIRPGERMSEFSARVNAALPVSGLINRTGKDPLGLKVGRTKTEKKMHRMYAEWREEERRIQEKRDEARELEEMEEMGEDGQVVWKDDESEAAKKRKGKKGKKRKMLVGELAEAEEDPWARVKRDRAEEKVGLNDIVKAPPTFTNVPKDKFKIRGVRVEVENIPKTSGSLRRREELGAVRQSVVEGYRKMMKESKTKLGAL